MIKMKIYDVYFRAVSPSIISVSAMSEKEAIQEATVRLNSMTKEEIIQRLMSAYEYEGFELVEVEDTGEEE